MEATLDGKREKRAVGLNLGDAYKPKGVVKHDQPYVMEVQIEGTSTLLFHRYDCEAAEAKSRAKKGSQERKTDNLESYVYRVPGLNEIGIPGINFKQCLVHSAKFNQDPRSPRKSAMDIFKAGLQVMPEVATLGVEHWDFEDKRGVIIQKARVARIRPAMKPGWAATFFVRVLLPEYITPDLLYEVITRAGMTVGLGDYRPEYGLFLLKRFERWEN
ncbi:MAG: hypothetical protein KCHDKBKB_01618 [Elusimicrobia bacterium]|nr:hypothetical protein [Elusimicrobiota bacterium]